MTQQMNLQKGLLAHLTMNDEDTDGSTLRDSSAYGNDVSLANSPTTGTSSVIGESYTFANVDNNFLDFGANGVTMNPGSTLSVWINADTIGTADHWIAPGIASQQAGDFDSYFALARVDEVNAEATGSVDTKLRVESLDGTSAEMGSFTYTTGTEIHVVFRFNEDNSIDGFVDASLIDSNAGPLDSFLLESVAQGYGAATNDGAPNGTLSDFRIYNRALTDSEINQLYQMRNEQHHYI